MRASKWSARATKNSVITAPTAKSELIFGFSDIKIGGGVLVYPCRSPGSVGQKDKVLSVKCYERQSSEGQ